MFRILPRASENATRTGARAAGPHPREPRLSARMRASGPRSRPAPPPRLVPCVSAHRGPRGGRFHGTNNKLLKKKMFLTTIQHNSDDRGRLRTLGPRAAGPHPREPRLSARMRASGPRSRRGPTPRLVPCASAGRRPPGSLRSWNRSVGAALVVARIEHRARFGTGRGVPCGRDGPSLLRDLVPQTLVGLAPEQ